MKNPSPEPDDANPNGGISVNGHGSGPGPGSRNGRVNGRVDDSTDKFMAVDSATSTKIIPELPHISNNIIPLSNVLKFYCQDAYKQLTNLIENLSSTIDTQSDVSRKKAFLQVIISLRQDFIKVYTLTKWAGDSKDISKLIDLLNWLRLQEFNFEELSFQLNSLYSFSGAKLPNSDINTALEVLINGRPQLPSYNFIKQPKISSSKILEVLQDLNLILATRMALNNNIPKRFMNNYNIKDGRIYFTIPNEFQVSVTVANDIVIDNESDYCQSPYYFVDFAFLFGLNPETSLITHRDNKIITKLPKSSHEKLEKVVNNVLLNQGLNGLYDLLHKYSISFKLYLIAKQLRDISINSKWRNNIQFNYQNGRSLIIINYWCGQYLSRNWKSFIELGIDKNYNLNFRWFKNGKYVINHDITGLFSEDLSDELSDADDDEPGDLSVDLILNIIVNKHSEILMKKIYEQLNEKFKIKQEGEEVSKENDDDQELLEEETAADQICSFITPHQLLIKLSPNKSTIFAINPLTGLYYFIDPTPAQDQFTKRINSQPQNVKFKNFVSENDMISNIISNLIQLRLETFNKEVNNKLITNGWINNEIIKLNEYETSKLFNFLLSNYETVTRIQFYRRKNLPSSWFLINLTNGTTSTTYWWVARIKSIKAEWKIQWMQKLQFDKQNARDMEKNNDQITNDGVEPYYLNYEFLSGLSTICSNMIIDHMILEELSIRNIKHLKTNKIEKVLERFGISEIPEDDDLIKQEDSREKPIIHETTIMIYNNNDLLPISISCTSLFLKIKLANLHGITQMKLKLFGKLTLSKISLDNFEELSLRVDAERKVFEVNDLVNLDTRLHSDGSVETNSLSNNEFDFGSSKNQLLDRVFNNLNKLKKLIIMLDQLDRNNFQVINNSINNIIVKIDNLDNLTIRLPERSENSIELESNSEGEVKLFISYLNRYLATHNDEEKTFRKHSEKKAVIIGVVKYIKEINPIIRSIDQIRVNINKPNAISRLPNGLPRLNFDVKIPTLDLIQFIYNINYTTVNSAKKIYKDKLVIDLSFKNNKFAIVKTPLIKLSMKNNWNTKNAKYKSLFESIFRVINEINSQKNETALQVQTPSSSDEKRYPTIIKLDRDFLINPLIIEKLLVRISDCFIVYLNSETNK
jgi:mediator of RNA polymerase II transcription subunit 14